LVVALAVVLDLVLSGGRVVDGTGAPWFRADVGIRGDRITAVGDLSRARARRRIELRDRMVAPGFIDMLGQSERFLLADDRVESKIRQGITTEITGEGESIAPTAPRLLVEVKPFDDRYGIRVDWSDLNGYFQRFRATLNLGTFFGAATARALVLGYGDVEANPAQIQMMQRLVGEAIEQGALGLSTALIYPPGSFARTPELIELAKVAARHGGIYATHVRGEAGTLFAALDEAIAIGREARIPVEVWHLKVAGRESWGRMKEVVARIEAARASGVDISANMYPYDAARNGLDANVPEWAHEGGTAAMIARFHDPEARVRIQQELWRGGLGAGGDATASAVLADVTHVARRLALGDPVEPPRSSVENAELLPMGEVRTRCYLRLAVDDVPGVFAQITRVLADHEIGLASVIQREPATGPADVVLLTYAAHEAAFAQAEAELSRLPCTRAVRARIRVEEART